jgi:hypothetical protein
MFCIGIERRFRWVKTGEEKILVLDAITAERINSFENVSSRVLAQ